MAVTDVSADAFAARAERHRRELHVHCYRLLGSFDEVMPPEDEPDAVVVARETIELAYLAVLQMLPPRQRAVLILRDVLEWSASETAEALETSVAAANSALQRAGATLEERRPPADDLTAADQELLQRLVVAHEQADVEAAVAVMRLEAGAVAEITTFNHGVFASFGLPATLDR